MITYCLFCNVQLNLQAINTVDEWLRTGINLCDHTQHKEVWPLQCKMGHPEAGTWTATFAKSSRISAAKPSLKKIAIVAINNWSWRSEGAILDENTHVCNMPQDTYRMNSFCIHIMRSKLEGQPLALKLTLPLSQDQNSSSGLEKCPS